MEFDQQQRQRRPARAPTFPFGQFIGCDERRQQQNAILCASNPQRSRQRQSRKNQSVRTEAPPSPQPAQHQKRRLRSHPNIKRQVLPQPSQRSQQRRIKRRPHEQRL